MTSTLALLFQIAPPALWGEALHVSGLFATIVKGLEEDKVSSPHRRCDAQNVSRAQSQLPTLVLTDYIYVLARIAIADRQLFLQLVSATSSTQNVREDLLWEAILNQWWTRVRAQAPSELNMTLMRIDPGQFDNMSEPRLRKLTAMGIANLVATGRPEVLDRLSTEIFNLWIDVFGEIKEALNNADKE